MIRLMLLIIVAMIAFFSLIGCAPQRSFKIGNGLQVESIKIEPSKGPKSVYKIERYT